MDFTAFEMTWGLFPEADKINGVRWDFQTSARIKMLLKGYRVSGHDLYSTPGTNSKSKAAMLYAVAYPDECLVVAGGFFNPNVETPYKGYIFTPVGIFKFDTGIDLPLVVEKAQVMSIVKGWAELAQPPIIMPLERLMSLCKMYGRSNKLLDDMNELFLKLNKTQCINHA